jgi:AcrR family transcriptional regulator
MMQTERQIQIIEESIKLIAEKGIQGFTIKNLSKAIGISEPAIYRHFESKTAILVAILDGFKEMAGMMSSISFDENQPAMEKVAFIFLRMLDLFFEQPTIISVIFSEEIFKNDNILKEKINEIQNLNLTKIERILEQGQKAGNVRNDIDKSSLALILMGAFRLLIKRWEINDYNFNLKQEGTKLINSLILIV